MTVRDANDTRPGAYDEAADTLSWDRTVAFFREHRLAKRPHSRDAHPQVAIRDAP
jgi:hypothetical protein